MTQRKTSRRAFLRGQAAVEALAAWTDGAGAVASLAEPAEGGYLIVYSRRAMATTFQVILNARQYPDGAEAAIEALDLIEQLEGQLTVYREDSEVMRLNRAAHQGPVLVEPRLYELLKEAARLHEITAGAFDVTAGPLAKVWGFYRRQGAVPAEADLAAAREVVGMRHLAFDDAEGTVEFAREGIEINLGAIGKGYALDRAAELLADRGVNDFLLHGGQSSVVARGNRGPPKEPEGRDAGWPINVGDPQRPGEHLASVRLRNEALGTSGAAYQSFRHAGKRYGHVLDPRTGWPAEGVLSATVIAPTAAAADALSTAVYVLGEAAAERLFAENADVAGMLVLPDEREGTARLRIWGDVGQA